MRGIRPPRFSLLAVSLVSAGVASSIASAVPPLEKRQVDLSSVEVPGEPDPSNLNKRQIGPRSILELPEELIEELPDVDLPLSLGLEKRQIKPRSILELPEELVEELPDVDLPLPLGLGKRQIKRRSILELPEELVEELPDIDLPLRLGLGKRQIKRRSILELPEELVEELPDVDLPLGLGLGKRQIKRRSILELPEELPEPEVDLDLGLGLEKRHIKPRSILELPEELPEPEVDLDLGLETRSTPDLLEPGPTLKKRLILNSVLELPGDLISDLDEQLTGTPEAPEVQPVPPENPTAEVQQPAATSDQPGDPEPSPETAVAPIPQPSEDPEPGQENLQIAIEPSDGQEPSPEAQETTISEPPEDPEPIPETQETAVSEPPEAPVVDPEPSPETQPVTTTESPAAPDPAQGNGQTAEIAAFLKKRSLHVCKDECSLNEAACAGACLFKRAVRLVRRQEGGAIPRLGTPADIDNNAQARAQDQQDAAANQAADQGATIQAVGGIGGIDPATGQELLALPPPSEFCQQSGQDLGDGTQNSGGFCSSLPQGQIPSVDRMVSSLIVTPDNGQQIPAGQAFTVTVQTRNLQTGFFTVAATEYYTQPQTLNAQGIVQGHQHVTIQRLTSLTVAPDANQKDFFKGLNDAAAGDGTLSTEVPGLATPGTYRICCMSGGFSHQPTVMPIAQRGAQDDCIRVDIVAGNAGGNAGNNNGGGTSGNNTGGGTSGNNTGGGTSGNNNGGGTSGNNTGGGTSGNNNGGGNAGNNNGGGTGTGGGAGGRFPRPRPSRFFNFGRRSG